MEEILKKCDEEVGKNIKRLKEMQEVYQQLQEAINKLRNISDKEFTLPINKEELIRALLESISRENNALKDGNVERNQSDNSPNESQDNSDHLKNENSEAEDANKELNEEENLLDKESGREDTEDITESQDKLLESLLVTSGGKKGVKYHIEVTSTLEKDCSFWACDKDTSFLKEKLEPLSSRLKRSSLQKDLCNISSSFKGLVCGKSQTSGLWLRGLIMKEISEEKVRVRLVDVGKTEEVFTRQLSKVPEDLAAIPFMAFHCKLFEEPCDVNYDVRWQFNDLVSKQILNFTVENIIEEDVDTFLIGKLETIVDKVNVCEEIRKMVNVNKNKQANKVPVGMGSRDIRMQNSNNGNTFTTITEFVSNQSTDEQSDSSNNNEEKRPTTPKMKSPQGTPQNLTPLKMPPPETDETSPDAVKWGDTETPGYEDVEFPLLDDDAFDSPSNSHNETQLREILEKSKSESEEQNDVLRNRIRSSDTNSDTYPDMRSQSPALNQMKAQENHLERLIQEQKSMLKDMITNQPSAELYDKLQQISMMQQQLHFIQQSQLLSQLQNSNELMNRIPPQLQQQLSNYNTNELRNRIPPQFQQRLSNSNTNELLNRIPQLQQHLPNATELLNRIPPRLQQQHPNTNTNIPFPHYPGAQVSQESFHNPATNINFQLEQNAVPDVDRILRRRASEENRITSNLTIASLNQHMSQMPNPDMRHRQSLGQTLQDPDIMRNLQKQEFQRPAYSQNQQFQQQQFNVHRPNMQPRADMQLQNEEVFPQPTNLNANPTPPDLLHNLKNQNDIRPFEQILSSAQVQLPSHLQNPDVLRHLQNPEVLRLMMKIPGFSHALQQSQATFMPNMQQTPIHPNQSCEPFNTLQPQSPVQSHAPQEQEANYSHSIHNQSEFSQPLLKTHTQSHAQPIQQQLQNPSSADQVDNPVQESPHINANNINSNAATNIQTNSENSHIKNSREEVSSPSHFQQQEEQKSHKESTAVRKSHFDFKIPPFEYLQSETKASWKQREIHNLSHPYFNNPNIKFYSVLCVEVAPGIFTPNLPQIYRTGLFPFSERDGHIFADSWKDDSPKVLIIKHRFLKGELEWLVGGICVVSSQIFRTKERGQRCYQCRVKFVSTAIFDSISNVMRSNRNREILEDTARIFLGSLLKKLEQEVGCVNLFAHQFNIQKQAQQAHSQNSKPQEIPAPPREIKKSFSLEASENWDDDIVESPKKLTENIYEKFAEEDQTANVNKSDSNVLPNPIATSISNQEFSHDYGSCDECESKDDYEAFGVNEDDGDKY